MNKAIIIAMLAALSGCGHNHYEYFVGQKGDTGAQGEAGPQGPAGADGADGADGQDATPITVVRLCPGVSVYPSTFVEVAFCLDNRLYAVYSANGGFQTEIPPGIYSSNAIGSACSFRVLPNCGIQAL